MSQQFLPNNPLPQEAKVPEERARFSPEVEAEVERHLAKYPPERRRSAMLPLMFIVQRERGYLDKPGVAYIADRLGVRITDVWETATFYSMIYMKPVGKYPRWEVKCLGWCGTPRRLKIGFDYHENLTAEKVDELLDACARDAYVF